MTTHDVRLDINVDEESWVGLYDRIEVWRSVLGEAGPYEEVTAPNFLPARVPADGGEPSAEIGRSVYLVNKELRLLVGELHEVVLVFTGVNPLTYGQAVLQITASGAPLVSAHVDSAGKLVVQTVALGAAARLEVLSSDAAPLLGLPITEPESVAHGADPRIPLVRGRSAYLFRDYFGQKTYFYKTRFVNALTGARSDFSDPIAAVFGGGVSAENLVVGFVRLVQRDGRPDVKKQVTIYAPVLGYQVDDSTVTGGQEVFLTDDQGYLEVVLVRGMEIDVGIGGTSLIRRVTVPTDDAVERFDLLSPDYGTDDAFAVRRLNLPLAERRNL